MGDTFVIQPLTQDLAQALLPYQRTGSSQPGHSAYSNGSTVFLNQGGAITDIGTPNGGNPGSNWGVIGLDGSDHVYAVANTTHNMENGLWEWNGGWQLIRTADIFHLTPAPVVNYSGQIALWAGGGTNPAHILEGSTSIPVIPSGDSRGYLTALDLNNSGQAVFILNGDHPFLYNAGQTFWLSDLVAPNSGWDLNAVSDLHLLEGGYVTGSASYNGVMTDFVLGPPLTPAPEPGTAALLGGGAVAALLASRRRKS